MILAIETSGPRCAVALGHRDGGLLGQYVLQNPQAHSEKLFPMIESLLATTATDRLQLTGVAFSMGPGSFTGLRIGMSAAKGLCYALNLPLVGVPTPDVIAKRIPSDARFHIVTASRKNEFYHALYEAGGRVDDIEVLSTEEVAGRLQPGDLLVCEAPEVILDTLDAALKPPITVLAGPWARPDAGALLELASSKFEAGAHEDLATVVPLYVQGFKGKVPA